MTIRIPDILEEHLRTDRSLRAVVDDAVAEFDAWLEDSKLPFFPDYTDHGHSHQSGVLATATALIAPRALARFSAADATVFIVATLLHDAAMHLSEAGFNEIIRGSFAGNCISEFDHTRWPELWEEFFFSAKRWDDRRLISIFGEAEPNMPRAYVTDPFHSWHNLTEGHRRLIGEFVRLHHARLAHEFAVFGIPGAGTTAIRLSSKMSPQLRDIAGVVARSHGLPARSCLEYLASKHHLRETQKCHAVYLMTLLRVSDYLQVDSSRSPAVVFRYKHIPSSISQLEHRSHQAVVNITTAGDDPESIEIQAEPADAATFLRLKEWLVGLQTELDASWAVLGEVYGLQNELADLELRFRRVRSNLDDVRRYAQSVQYLPERIRFDVARSELLKLLIRPLYGGKPEVGIRELTQNSVDAVRELHELQRQHPDLKDIALRSQDADVEVWLDEPDESGFAILTVSDRGIGMDATVIRDYFLRAGASYRQSERWKESFENPTSEDEPRKAKCRVLRSGRFGVGVLAAFLLGDRVRVVTRHVRAAEGLEFETTLDAEVIEVRKVPNCLVGTVLQVRVPREIYDELLQQDSRVSRPAQWEWYQFTYPSVTRYVGSSKQLLDSAVSTDIADADLIWNHLETELAYKVHWSYTNAPALTCNGIFVRNSETLLRFPPEIAAATQYTFSHPNIAVLDSDAQFPLTLPRDRFDGEVYPFVIPLLRDVTEFSFAQILRQLPDVARLPELTRTAWRFAQSSGFFFGGTTGRVTRRNVSESGLFLTEGVLSIYDNAVCEGRQIKRLVLLACPDDVRLLPLEYESDAAFWVSSYNRFAFGESANAPEFLMQLAGSSHKVIGLRFATKFRSYMERIDEHLMTGSYAWSVSKATNRSKEIERIFSVAGRHGRWCVVETKDCPTSGIDWTYLDYLDDVKTKEHFAVVEVFLETPLHLKFSAGFVADIWREIFGSGGIPVDREAREATLREAYQRLARFIPIAGSGQTEQAQRQTR